MTIKINRRAGLATGIASMGGLFLPIGGCGRWRPTKDDTETANDILNGLHGDYVDIMLALADLKTGPRGQDGHPFNERWPEHANPLIVRMQKDLGADDARDDCLSWCAVALSWCLRRSGRAVPVEYASSQSYLTYGEVVNHPVSGDIAVFTNNDIDKGGGHVTIFRGFVSTSTIEALGGNQQLSEAANCGSGYPVSAIDQRHMDKITTVHHLNRFVRPPAPSLRPIPLSGPTHSS